MRFHLILTTLIAMAVMSPASAQDSRYGTPKSLPEPDYEAVARQADHVSADEEYVEILPERWSDCTANARPYAATGATKYMADASRIRKVCLKAMMLRLAATYFDPRIFGRGVLLQQLEALDGAVWRFIKDMHVGTPDCVDHPFHHCGTLFEVTLPNWAHEDLLANLVESAALATGRIRDLAGWRAAWAEAGDLEF
jgi:hypothetical protein